MRELLEQYRESLQVVATARARTAERGGPRAKGDLALLADMEADLEWAITYMTTGWPPAGEHRRLPREFPVDPHQLNRYLASRVKPRDLQALRERVHQQLRTALADLSPREQDIYWLAEACAWSMADVADHLGVTKSRVQSALRRARTKLTNSYGIRSAPI